MDVRVNLAAAARQFYRRGWMVGTTGDLSARLDDDSLWITRSAKPKGELGKDDFLRVRPDDDLRSRDPDDEAPPAETVIHRAIYALFPQARVVYHVHSVEANLVTEWNDSGAAALPPLEMLKGFDIWEQEPSVTIPIFENHLRVPYIANEVRERFTTRPPDVPGFLIRHHGLTVWADTPDRARTYVELFDYLFRYMIARRT